MNKQQIKSVASLVTTAPTKYQRKILRHLAAANHLIRDKSKGSWFDSVAGDFFQPASCQWLLDEGFLELAGSSPKFENFKLSDKGLIVVAYQQPDRERMVA